MHKEDNKRERKGRRVMLKYLGIEAVGQRERISSFITQSRLPFFFFVFSWFGHYLLKALHSIHNNIEEKKTSKDIN